VTTSLLLAALLLGADPAPPNAEPKPVPVTRAEVKEALEGHKKATPRLPMPPADPDNPQARVNNGLLRSYYLAHLGTSGTPAGTGREPDPAMTIDSTFKVKLFWVTSRANNCYYCLGHQELKLSAAGQTDDQIAALDGDWAALPEAERVAAQFAANLTAAPHAVTDADLDLLKKHYTPTQVSEIVVTVAGYNSTNRWTDGLNIPGEASGERFSTKSVARDFATFKTPTSAKYAGRATGVAPVAKGSTATCKPTPVARPPLESREEVEAAWKLAATRTPRLPLADGAGPNWQRALNVFAKSSASRIAGLKTAAEKGDLTPRLKAEIAWVAAREDRAWYALDLARRQLKAVGLSDDEIFALNGPAKDLPESERLTLAFARKLATAPSTVTDADVEGLRKHHKDRAVAEVVHHVCNAAFLNRVTETAGLPLDR